MKKLLIALVLTLLFSSYSSAHGAFPPPQCRIEIDNAHISTFNVEQFGKRTVKIVARSKCELYQEKVDLTLEIWKSGKIFDRKIKTFKNLKNSGYVVAINHAYIPCKNSKLTHYYAIAKGKAFIEGKWRIAPLASTKNEKQGLLKCGT